MEVNVDQPIWGSDSVKDRWAWLLLALLTMLGAYLRFYHLGYEPLRFDEVATWNQSRQANLRSLIEAMRGDVHPPGWTILMYYVQKVIGGSEFALRLPSAIAGVLSIPAIFFLAKLIYGRSAGLIAAGLMAFLWAPVFYSQEARAYSLLILFSILTFHCLIRIISSSEEHRRNYFLIFSFILLSTILSYLHYSGLLMVLVQGGWAIVRTVNSRRMLTKLLTIYLAILLLYAPWLIEMFSDLNRGSFWIEKVYGPSSIIDFWFYRSYFELHFPVAILLGFVFLQEVVSMYREKRKFSRSHTLMLFAWLTLPYLAFLAKSIISTPLILPRYLLISAPAAYILLGSALTKLTTGRKSRLAIGLCITLFCLWTLLFKIQYYTLAQRPQTREVIYTLTHASETTLADSLVMSYRFKNVFNYYFFRAGVEKRVDYDIQWQIPVNIKRVPKKEIQNIKSLVRSSDKKYIWFIAVKPHRARNVIEMLNEEAIFIKSEKFKRTEARLYKKKIAAKPLI